MKYKTKYLNLKINIQSGGVYSNLKNIGAGTESTIFEMENGKILRIPNDRTIGVNERNIVVFLISNPLQYFPRFYEIGSCKNSKIVDSTLKEFCDGDPKETSYYDYNYVIMDKINGKQMYNIFLDIFKDDVKDKLIVNETKMNEFKKFYISVIKKIIQGFINAKNKMNGFYHTDFGVCNCLITPDGDPVIIDFGRSLMGKKLKIIDKKCRDISEYHLTFTIGLWVRDFRSFSVEDLYNMKSITHEFKSQVKNNVLELLEIFREIPEIKLLTELIDSDRTSSELEYIELLKNNYVILYYNDKKNGIIR